MICSENKNEDKTGGVGLGIILVSESANGSHPGLDPSGFIKTVSEDTQWRKPRSGCAFFFYMSGLAYDHCFPKGK